MDIDLLSKLVGELILRNDEVGLPGVGTFVAEIVPSTFSDKGYTINPPYRRLTFRPGTVSDESLIEHYARTLQVDLNTAKESLEAFLSEMKQVLIERKTIVFPGLGRLRATRENHFFFVCDEDLDIYPEGFGLQPISLKTHAAAHPAPATVLEPLQSQDQNSQPAFSDDSAPVPETQSAAAIVSDHEAIPEHSAIHEPESVPEEVSATERASVADSETESEPEAAAESEVINENEATESRRRGIPAAVVVLLVLIAVAAIAFGAFILLARYQPEFIDSILYTPEELEILRW